MSTKSSAARGDQPAAESAGEADLETANSNGTNSGDADTDNNAIASGSLSGLVELAADDEDYAAEERAGGESGTAAADAPPNQRENES